MFTNFRMATKDAILAQLLSIRSIANMVKFIKNNCSGYVFKPNHKGWGYSCPLHCPCSCGGPKPMHRFSPNFQGVFTLSGLGLGGWGYLVTIVAMETKRFYGLKDFGCSTA